MNYLHHYNLLIERAKHRVLKEYTETHHIVPRCIGGTDELTNLVELTPEEHYLAHQLLIKIYPSNEKLVYAAVMMIPSRPSNKLYGWLRRRYVTICKQRTGTNNNSFGTVWVNNGTSAFRINKDDPMEEGWKVGRSVKKRYCVTCNKEVTDGKVATFCKEHRIYMKPERLEKIKKPLALIEKNGKVKEVSRNQVPSYETYGWKRV